MAFDLLSQQLINAYQRGFPLCSRPFLQLAEEFDVSEQRVIACLEKLNQQQVLSRLGPVFDHQQAGASSLAAIAVPEGKLDEVAAIVNQFKQVNHNYARENKFNLWFVVTAQTSEELTATIADIEVVSGLPVLMLPMEKSYHIDLSFDVSFEPELDKVSE